MSILFEQFPLLAQAISLAPEPGVGFAAGEYTVETKMTKIITQLAPADQQHGVYVINYRQWKYAPATFVAVFVAVTQVEFAFFADRAAH